MLIADSGAQPAPLATETGFSGLAGREAGAKFGDAVGRQSDQPSGPDLQAGCAADRKGCGMVSLAHAGAPAVRIISLKKRRAYIVGTFDHEHRLPAVHAADDVIHVAGELRTVSVADIGQGAKQMMRAQSYGHCG